MIPALFPFLLSQNTRYIALPWDRYGVHVPGLCFPMGIVSSIVVYYFIIVISWMFSPRCGSDGLVVPSRLDSALYVSYGCTYLLRLYVRRGGHTDNDTHTQISIASQIIRLIVIIVLQHRL